MEQAQQRLQPGMELQRSESGISIRSVDGEDRTFEMSISSESPVSRWGWTEILCHDEGCVDLSRLNDGGVVLYGHKTDIASVVGPIIKAWVDPKDKKCRIRFKVDDDPDAEKVYKKLMSGTLKKSSVGYRVTVWEEVAANAKSTNGRFIGPCDVAMRWQPYEGSVVPIPADDAVGVGRSHAVPLTADAPKSKRERELFLLSLSPKG